VARAWGWPPTSI